MAAAYTTKANDSPTVGMIAPRMTVVTMNAIEPQTRARPKRDRSGHRRWIVRASTSGVRPEVPTASSPTASASHGRDGPLARTSPNAAAHSAPARYGGRTSPSRSATRPQAGAATIATADGIATSSPIVPRLTPSCWKYIAANATHTPTAVNWNA